MARHAARTGRGDLLRRTLAVSADYHAESNGAGLVRVAAPDDVHLRQLDTLPPVADAVIDIRGTRAPPRRLAQ